MSVSTKKLSVLHDSEGNQINLGNVLGRGGEGAVYTVLDQSDLVAKIYFKDVTNEKALKLMGMAKGYNTEIGKIAAWPYRALYKSPNSSPVGFLMKKISGYKDIHELYGVASRKQEFPKADWSFLLLSARNLASAISVVHQNGCVVGDLNDRNILVGPDAIVKLIDCDSYQIAYNGKTFFCEVGVPEYTSPELQGKSFNGVIRTPNHDNFALAVFIFKLLFLARHPFFGKYLGRGEQPSTIAQAIEKYYFYYSKNAALNNLEPPPGTLTIGSISPQISTLFERAFSRDSSRNSGRPSAREWITALDDLKGNLKTCTNNPSHMYYKQINSCPWCALEASSPVILFSFSSSTKTINTGNGYTNVTEIKAIWARISNVASPGPASQVHFGPASLSLASAPLPTNIANEINGQHAKNVFQAIFVGAIELAVAIFIIYSGLWGYALGFFFITIPLVAWAISNVKDILSREPDSQAYRDERDKRSKELKVAQEKFDYAQKRWQELATDKRFQDKRLELEKAYNTLQNLDRDYKNEIQKLEANRRAYQLQKYLEKYLIDRAKLDGIGTGLKAQLASYGIDTAADITRQRVYGVPGFGDVRVSTLMSWRNSLEAKFIFNPNQGIDPRDLQTIKNKYDQQRYTLINRLKAGESELLTIKNDILSKRNTWTPQIKALLEELGQKTVDMRVFSNLHFPVGGKGKKVSTAPFVWGALIIGIVYLFANLGNTHSSQNSSTTATYTDQPAYNTQQEVPVTPVVYYITGHEVNLRQFPDATSTVISTIPIGQEVTEIERQGDWVHVSYPGETSVNTGWISSSFLDTSENALNIIKTKIEDGRKKIDAIFLDLMVIEKDMASKTEKIFSLESDLKEKKALPPKPDSPRIDLSSSQTIQEDSTIQQESAPTQEEIGRLETEIQGLEADLKKASITYKQKRTQYQKLREFDDAYIDSYQKLSVTQDLQKLTDNEQVSYVENTSYCGSAGCSLTIKDSTERVIFSGMSQTPPYFLFTLNSGFRSFIIKQKDYYSYQPGDSAYSKLYIYDESQGQYTLSNDDEATFVSKMEVF